MNQSSWEASTWIAVLSLLVATLAALYARWVWSEARKTNLLALHAHRLQVFRAFQKLRNALQAQGMGVTAEAAREFYQPSQESKFYFSSKKTHELLVKYFEVCWAIAQEKRKLDRSNLDQVTIEQIHRKQDELSALEQSIYAEAEKQVENELTQAVRHRWFDA